MAQNRGPWLSTATALFFGWALFSFIVRLWVMLGRKQSWNTSDSTICGAFFVALLHISVTFYAIHNGYGRPISDIDESKLGGVEKALFAAQIFYILSIGLTRVSTGFFISNLTRHHPQILASRILAGTAGLWAVVSVFVVALRPSLSRPWATLDGTESLFRRWIAVETTGMVVELALFGLSVSLIWGLQMKLRKKLLILSAFACRIVIIPLVVVRLYYLSPAKNHDPTLSNILAGIWTEGALEYAIIASSVTALKPFLKPFHSGAIVNTVGGSGSGAHSGSYARRQDIYMLGSLAADKEPIQTSNTSSATKSTRSGRKKQKVDFAPAANKNKLFVGPGQTQGHSVVQCPTDARDDERSVGSNSSEQMIIRTTSDWSVRYEAH